MHKTAEKTDEKPAILTLPFTAQVAEIIVLWAPQRGGEYEVQCARGKQYAREALTYMRQQENPALLGQIVREIVIAGKYEGVEIGFCHGLGVELLGLG